MSGNNKGRRRRWGAVRKLPSGRYQARYPGPDGQMRSADQTFASTTDAERWLTLKEADIANNGWVDPEAGKVKFRQYAETWVSDRVIKRRTEELYRGLLKNHLMPTFGDKGLNEIKEADVRRWRKKLLDAGTGAVTVAKAYRLMRAILNTAVNEDEILRKNPCRIKGAGKEESEERPVVPLPVVFDIADRVPARYRALVLLATFANLRWGELAGLRRKDLDLDAGTVKVTASLAELDAGGLVDDTPKSAAGRRTVAFPPELVADIRDHLERFAEEGEGGFVFIGPKGGRLRRSNFRKTWNKVRTDIGMPDLHFHDLRHTGNTLAATTGATLRELMARMGHSSTRAAMIYLHATSDRDRAIAEALGKLMGEHRTSSDEGDAGDDPPAAGAAG